MFGGIEKRKSAPIVSGTTTSPFALVSRHSTSAGATGKPNQGPGTGMAGRSEASATSATRPQTPSVGSVWPCGLRRSIELTTGRVRSW